MMWVRLAIVVACGLSACAGFSEEGFVSIFNGRDFSGWEGSWTNGYYRVAADGSLECVGGKGWGGKTIRNIWTAREYSNFVFRCEYKVTPRTNNGIGIRCPPKDYITSSGMEVQILEDESDDYYFTKKKVPVCSLNASIYGVAAARRQSERKGFLKPVGEWNRQEIRAEGSRVTIVLNGETVVDADLSKIDARGGTPDGKPHPGIRRPGGHITLCWHNDTMWFRNLEIKELK